MAPFNRDNLRQQGDGLRDAGMGLAAGARPERVTAGKAALLRALLNAPDGTATIDDATADLSAEFRDGGKWRGTVTRSLAVLGLIEPVGAEKSDRPSRHRGYVTRWRLRDRQKAVAYLASLVRSLDARLTTADDLAAQEKTPAAPCGKVAVAGALDRSNPLTGKDANRG
ncbi:MAG: hypothetical protein KF847_18490 [Pirellulales bacterium]|nr:hypothetical protein [Pirellulales bacterium]